MSLFSGDGGGVSHVSNFSGRQTNTEFDFAKRTPLLVTPRFSPLLVDANEIVMVQKGLLIMLSGSIQDYD